MEVQNHTFLKWTNAELNEEDLGKIDSLEKDFQSGVMLITLLEHCMEKKYSGPFKKVPKGKIQEMENLNGESAVEIIAGTVHAFMSLCAALPLIRLVDIFSISLLDGTHRLWTILLVRTYRKDFYFVNYYAQVRSNLCKKTMSNL